MKTQKYLIIIDFLFQKYEIEYEENMTATEAIKKVQQFLFPSEKREDQIYTSKDNEDDHTKLRLYRSTPSQYTEATPVTEPITPKDLDYNAYQFYLFRPIVNVFITMHIIKEIDLGKGEQLAEFDVIYPIKKKFLYLKDYLYKTLKKYMKENNSIISELLKNGFTFRYETENGQFEEYKSEQYIEKTMNGKTVFLVINQIKSDKKSPFNIPGRLYYIVKGLETSAQKHENEINESNLNYIWRGKPLNNEFVVGRLDYRGDLTLDSLKERVKFREFDWQIIKNKNIFVSFNGMVQTEKFNNMNDLLFDDDFYYFTITVLPADKKLKFRKKVERTYDIKVPENGRPLIIRIEIQGQNKGNKHLEQLNHYPLNSSSNNNIDSSNNSNISIDFNNYNNNDISKNSTNIHAYNNKIEIKQNDESKEEEINDKNDDDKNEEEEINVKNDDNKNKEEEIIDKNDDDKNKEEEINDKNDDNKNEEEEINDKNDDDKNKEEERNNDEDRGNDDNEKEENRKDYDNDEDLFDEENEIIIDNSSFENNDSIEIKDDNYNNDNDINNDEYSNNDHIMYDNQNEYEIDNEELLDLFFFYYKKFLSESSHVETPEPTYYPKLSKEDSDLFDKFLSYFDMFRKNL